MDKVFAQFTPGERALLARLDTPQKIQDFVNALKINFEEDGDTSYSPRQVMARRTAHCAEAAIFAATALWYHGAKPLLMDLKSVPDDYDHVVALFRRHGRWGAISKTNHGVLRYREPVYATPRELALSYFHEYTDPRGRKTMRSYSAPFDLSKLKDRSWPTTDGELWDIIEQLDDSKHFSILNTAQLHSLRRADQIEIKIGAVVERKPRKK